MAFSIAMGVRKGDVAFEKEIDEELRLNNPKSLKFSRVITFLLEMSGNELDSTNLSERSRFRKITWVKSG